MKKSFDYFLIILIFFISTATSCGKKTVKKNILSPVKYISASSRLKSRSNKYSEAYLFDGTGKSWVEGRKGSGINEAITIRFEKKAEINHFYIKNGYGDEKYFLKNNRVKELVVRGVSTSTKETVLLKDSKEMQLIALKKPIKDSAIMFKIKSVYKSNKYDDTAIAEISFSKIKNFGKKRSIITSTPYDLKEKYELYSITLMPDGSLSGIGDGASQCPEPFDGGIWGYTKSGDVFIQYIVSEDVNCGDMSYNGPEKRRKRYSDALILQGLKIK